MIGVLRLLKMLSRWCAMKTKKHARHTHTHAHCKHKRNLKGKPAITAIPYLETFASSLGESIHEHVVLINLIETLAL